MLEIENEIECIERIRMLTMQSLWLALKGQDYLRNSLAGALSSLPGAAISSIKIDDILHEFPR